MRRMRLLMLLLLSGCGVGQPKADAGTIDLRSWNIERPVWLRGEWELYWERMPDGHPDGTLPAILWRGAKLLDGRKVPGQGWAVYRMRVLVPESIKRSPRRLELDTEGGNTAYRISITSLSGQPMCVPVERGVFAHDASAHGTYRRAQITFTTGDDFFINFEVSNFETLSGGLWTAPLLGAAERVDSTVQKRRDGDFLVLGILLVMAIHHLAMFVLRRSERGPLWLALLTIDVGIRMLVAARHMDDPAWMGVWALWFRLEILTFYLGVPPFLLFLRAVLPDYTPRTFVRVCVAISLGFAAVMALAPTRLSYHTLPVFRLFTVVVVVRLLHVMIRAARAEKDALPFLMLIGSALLSGAVMNDVLLAQGLVESQYIAHYGMSGFILFQSLLLAVANARARRQSEAYAQEMTTLNEELRRQIGDRSHRLAQTLTLLASDARKAAELEAGRVMGDRYRIQHLLGAGGMGAVYAATRIPDDKPVALKVVRLSASPDLLARFAREAEAAAKVNHPNVVAILDVDVSDDGELFIVMERVHGKSLDAVRARFGEVAWALPLLAQLARALEAIHAADVIHRDLKPANILLTDEGVLKVADFGIAGLRTGAADDDESTGSLEKTKGARPSTRQSVLTESDAATLGLTQAGAVLGSPLYMAPEARAGARHTSRSSDIYSFGLIAYELLSGKRAIGMSLSHNPAEERPAQPLATLCPSLPRELTTLVDACLRPDPRTRPSATDLRTAFAQHQSIRARAL
jgi:hypothetical protein